MEYESRVIITSLSFERIALIGCDFCRYIHEFILENHLSIYGICQSDGIGALGSAMYTEVYDARTGRALVDGIAAFTGL